MKQPIITLSIFGILNLLDVAATVVGLHLGAIEGNPLLMARPIGAMLVYKALIVFGVIAMIRVVLTFHIEIGRAATRLFAVLNGIMMGIVINNIITILRIIWQ